MNLGDRMKEYERVTQNSLMRRVPMVLRLDGKAFHTFTKGMRRPFDERLTACMANTTKYLVDNIQGAVFGYTQSDEISILVRDYDTIRTDMWFGGNVQKITSVSASMATAKFNTEVAHMFDGENLGMALFDSRVFSLPQHEVCNYFIFRQQDCTRNSVQATGQHFLGHKRMQGLSNSEVQDALMNMDIPVNWNDLIIPFRRGVCYTVAGKIDSMIPVFTQCREYIDQHVYIQNITEENYDE